MFICFCKQFIAKTLSVQKNQFAVNQQSADNQKLTINFSPKFTIAMNIHANYLNMSRLHFPRPKI